MGGEKGCSSVGRLSSSIVMGILVAIEFAIWLPFQIYMVPIGWMSAVSSVATFLPMTDGQVMRPLMVWKASSSGQCLN